MYKTGLVFALVLMLVLAPAFVSAETWVGTMTMASTALVAMPQPSRLAIKAISPGVRDTRTVRITAYSSTPEETDDTPFTTALGTQVRDGIIAANFLPFGTRVRIPKVFGSKVFVVEDRMNRRHTNVVDVWMPSKELARTFGKMNATIEVLD